MNPGVRTLRSEKYSQKQSEESLKWLSEIEMLVNTVRKICNLFTHNNPPSICNKLTQTNTDLVFSIT